MQSGEFVTVRTSEREIRGKLLGTLTDTPGEDAHVILADGETHTILEGDLV